jgi:hypothetical protein
MAPKGRLHTFSQVRADDRNRRNLALGPDSGEGRLNHHRERTSEGTKRQTLTTRSVSE